MKHLMPLLLVLAACAPAGQQPPLAPAPAAGQTSDTCNAAGFADLVGQDATVLERTLILAPIRVIRPGMAVTMDYLAGRINFGLDAANRITTVTCG